MLAITIDQADHDDAPKLARPREDLEEWLAGLDPDEVEHQWEVNGEVPAHC